MEYIIPFVISLLVFCYNYRKVIELKKITTCIKHKLRAMDENDKWIVGEFQTLSNKIANIDKKIAKLEVKLSIFTAIAVFVSTFASTMIMKFIS